ncbi:protein unc-93 homolog A-like isoform X2 [Mercenaria mercenaria]|uniref:protein unc-93 homolog A-like isoform X2 n=1 Tax=Mercenaria mercenaria TaxID=6596 RepID=UPI00234F5739|nr:protein unc-93 homolog A-like isoform X2 [Mercenaria mercenaria]
MGNNDTIGTGAATLWAAKCTYLTSIGAWYAKITNSSRAGTISVFFGVFYMIFQTSHVWGNLISSTVFSQKIPENLNISDDVLEKCGAAHCPSDYQNNTNLDRPDMTKIYTVCGIYLGCACLGFVTIAIFLDKIDHETDGSQMTTKQLLGAMARHFYNSKYQKLLIPLTMYSGFEAAFFAGDYTRSFISCSMGVWNVGYVMIAYGVADAACSLIIGRLVKYTGFLPWFILTLYGYLFTQKPETAFASHRLCESAGFIIAFGYSSYICTYIKIYVCLIFVTVGTLLYCVVEAMQRKQTNKHKVNTTEYLVQ